MPNSIVPAAATGLPRSRRSAKPLIRFVVPLPVGMTPRQAIEAQIEALIDHLDKVDPDPDLEDGSDQEASNLAGAPSDLEHDLSDHEPSLGFLERVEHIGLSAGCIFDCEINDVPVNEVRL